MPRLFVGMNQQVNSRSMTYLLLTCTHLLEFPAQQFAVLGYLHTSQIARRNSVLDEHSKSIGWLLDQTIVLEVRESRCLFASSFGFTFELVSCVVGFLDLEGSVRLEPALVRGFVLCFVVVGDDVETLYMSIHIRSVRIWAYLVLFSRQIFECLRSSLCTAAINSDGFSLLGRMLDETDCPS